ncbi:hypothetical protein ACFYNO_36035 [Kitasatospora sp. NPDC006697]|uniref:hypothetical protein n=1 Tax=Kitasatospora sp. NPDC006697 TaxID=3364020 RepID=UPI0036896FE0
MRDPSGTDDSADGCAVPAGGRRVPAQVHRRHQHQPGQGAGLDGQQRELLDAALEERAVLLRAAASPRSKRSTATSGQAQQRQRDLAQLEQCRDDLRDQANAARRAVHEAEQDLAGAQQEEERAGAKAEQARAALERARFAERRAEDAAERMEGLRDAAAWAKAATEQAGKELVARRREQP